MPAVMPVRERMDQRACEEHQDRQRGEQMDAMLDDHVHPADERERGEYSLDACRVMTHASIGARSLGRGLDTG